MFNHIFQLKQPKAHLNSTDQDISRVQLQFGLFQMKKQRGQSVVTKHGTL